MLRLILYIVYLVVCAGAFVTYVTPTHDGKLPTGVVEHGGLAFLILLALAQIIPLVDWLIPRKRIEIISAIYFGLLIGVLLSIMFLRALEPALSSLKATEYLDAVRIVVTLAMTYLSVSLLLQTKDDFRFIIPYVEFARELKGRKPLILDSSALIDGRIADVIETKILDSRIIVPAFILREIQDIADSGDKNRRSRGRRGLDILSRLQNNAHVEISVYETEAGDGRNLSVDQRLVELAKEIGGRVVTNDFNLNKVAQVLGVDVINLNDVANSLKPRYLPGDHMRIKVLKGGESPTQGVGYLDDGTMVVCEQANDRIGMEIDVVVTSVLQSSAGRMIFGRTADASHKS
jgi:uncharacterized protein YacL